MKTAYDFISEFILPHENAYQKGHASDPAYVVAEHVSGDAGGTTKYGIDARYHPGIDIEALTRAQAIAIYQAEFTALHWALAGHLPPSLTEFPYPSAFAFFDCREVCGAHAAWLCLQRALGLTADGIPGLHTRTAILKAPAQTLCSTMIDERMKYHQLVAANHPEDRKFLAGWLNRCEELRAYCASLNCLAPST